jgi:hypothetical protein
MKIFKIMAVALVAMLGLFSCSEDCDHDFVEYDHSEVLVGTWTYIAEDGLAEAMVINPDGSFTTTGIMKGGYLYEEKGNIKVVNNKVSLVFEGDTDVIEGRLELVAGKSLSIVINEEYDIRLTYDYCANDLSDEILGMWVSELQAPTENGEAMIVHTFMDNGKAIFTGFGTFVDEYLVNEETTYKVIGDLLFFALPQDKIAEGEYPYITKKLTYIPNGAAYGDIMEEKTLRSEEEKTSTMLRIKQSLNLSKRTYDYISAYVTNANGKDEDFSILGNTFNISKIKSYDLDMMFRSILSCIELNENTIKFTFNNNGRESVYNDPITVDGNKVTVDMSTENPACRKVEMYMFQDADDSQLHIYMPTKSFINYFANLQIPTLKAEGKLDINDAAAVDKVFADMEARVESINVSFVLKARK